MGYTIYCLIVTAAFLYLLFPSGAIKACIQAKARRIHPGIQVTSERLSLVFPAGLRLFQAAFSLEGYPGRPLFKADRICLRPKIWSVLKDSGEASLTISDGLLKLAEPVLGVETVDFKEIQVKMSLKGQRISISTAELKGSKMTGTFSGAIDMDSDFMESRLDLHGKVEPAATFFRDVPGAGQAINLIKDGKVPFTLKGTIRDPRMDFI